jgi:hypothetical protein
MGGVRIFLHIISADCQEYAAYFASAAIAQKRDLLGLIKFSRAIKVFGSPDYQKLQKITCRNIATSTSIFRTKTEMDDFDVAATAAVLHLLLLLNTLEELGKELNSISQSSGSRTVYIDRNRGEKLANELSTTVSTRIFNATRLNHAQFTALLEWLHTNTSFADSKHVSAAEKLIIFLYICAHNTSFRGVQELVHHSISTIHLVFQETLDALCVLHQQFVRPPSGETPEIIRNSGKFYPMFKDAIGALDGTHIHISVGRVKSREAKVPWRCRKGYTSQNVLAAVDFDMNFVYVLAGWEGSAHDSRVLRSAVQDKGFSAPPNKYYLADAGYGPFGGLCLSPYHKVRYHLREWGAANQRPKNAQELFNLRHSSLRVTIERTFGVLKNRFSILTTARDGFSIASQVKLVYALTGLHNFLNKHGADPYTEWTQIEDATNQQEGPVSDDVQFSDERSEERRDQIANEMWMLYQEELERRATCSNIVLQLDELEQ